MALLQPLVQTPGANRIIGGGSKANRDEAERTSLLTQFSLELADGVGRGGFGIGHPRELTGSGGEWRPARFSIRSATMQ